MFAESYELHREFPEYKDKIVMLQATDWQFDNLCEEYQKVSREVSRVINLEDTEVPYLNNLKKSRSFLKGQLYAILQQES